MAMIGSARVSALDQDYNLQINTLNAIVRENLAKISFSRVGFLFSDRHPRCA